ncbi:hypothetical protein [Flavobacterium sp. WV_118_3]|uniref:hypothetical protein n=1 Tax=Flavobacterium sp. WV_118_3 TaxID=3151764 RepID=UPI0010A2B917
MNLFIKLLLFVFVALVTNVKVMGAAITFPNIQERTNSNLFHTQIAKTDGSILKKVDGLLVDLF